VRKRWQLPLIARILVSVVLNRQRVPIRKRVGSQVEKIKSSICDDVFTRCVVTRHHLDFIVASWTGLHHWDPPFVSTGVITVKKQIMQT